MDYLIRLFFPGKETVKHGIDQERNTHRWLRWCGVFFLLCLSDCILFCANLAASEILVVTSGSTGVYKEAIDSFALSLRATCKRRSVSCQDPYEVIHLDQVSEDELRRRLQENRRLIVTAGRQAAMKIADLDPAVPILHTLIPRETYQQLAVSNRAPSVSAIFIDQPIDRRLLLLKTAMPERTRIGVLVSRASKDVERMIERSAKRYGLHPIFETLEDEEQLGSVLNRLLDRSDILLAIPDPYIFNRNTVRNILLSSYHHQIPVIGFSAAYVKAGAIIAVFSTPEEIGRQAGEIAANHIIGHNNRLPPPAYPKYFSVVCNQSVSNSLQINLPDAKQLETSLREASR